MKHFKNLLIITITFNLLFACKKKDCIPASTVVGFWKGTCTVTGTSVQAIYKYFPTFKNINSISATSNTGFTTMSGTWGFNSNTSGGGTINLTKQ